MSKRIVITTGGTLGDHLPFIALGAALKQRGHQVVMALNPAMLVYAERAGLEVVALPDIARGPDHARQNAHVWDHWAKLEGRASPPVAPDISLDEYIEQARVLAECSRTADLLISTSIRVLGLVAHHVSGVPLITASMNPSMFAATGDQAQSPEVGQYAALITRMVAALGGQAPLIRSASDLHARHILLASSRHFSVAERAGFAAETSITQTGFWFYADPAWAAWQPDPALRAFAA
ncbi:MAG: glycosyltransferase, partial [Roseiflexaceae bacterium]|nr:glycosyltransferase [Roseiflexaceae bacterium]